MKAILLFLFSAPFFLLAQSPEAEALVKEGIERHDEGDFAGAMEKYQAALEMEADNYFVAEAEIAHTLFYQHKFETCAARCEHILQKYPKEDGLGTIFVTLGNALDNLERPKEAIDAYERGIARFPDVHLLYFNLGVTYTRNDENEKAVARLLDGLKVAPNHPGSHYILGIALLSENRRTPALFAFSKLLLLEYGTQRTQNAAGMVTEIMQGNAEKTGRNEIQIDASASIESLEKEYDNFTMVDFSIDLIGASRLTKDFKKKTKKMDAAQVLAMELGDLIDVVSEEYENGGLKGPLTKEYVPFFQELKEKGYLETLGYVVYTELGEKFAVEWVKANLEEVESLLKWVFE